MWWPRRVASVMVVVLLVAAPPVLLLRLTGWPLPGWPSGEQLRGWVAEPITTGTVTAALTVGGWLLWLLVVVVVVLRVMARVRVVARWMRRMPLPTPWQATATGLAGVAVLGTNTAATAAPVAEQPTATTTPAAGDASHEPVNRQTPDLRGETAGVVVPGGWLPRETAEQVAAAAVLLWLWRRRSYRPAAPDPDRRDLDWAPLPAVVVAAQTAVTTGTGQSDDRTDQDSSAAGDQDGAGPAVLVFPPGGVGLTGPGASDAARGLLITAALRALRNPTPVVRLITTRADLNALLGPHPPVPALAGIHVAATLEDALTLAAPRPTATPPCGGEQTTVPDRLLLLTYAPVSDRLTAAVADRDLAVVVVGECPDGDTWSVDASGHIHPHQHLTAGRRMCVLDVAATRDLLTVIIPPDTPTTGGAPTPAPPSPPRPRTPDRGTIHHTRGDIDRPDPVPLRLRVLGGVDLLFRDTPVVVRRSAALQALVYLAVYPDGATGRDLVGAIWPGLPSHRVTGRLYTTMSDLRKVIRDASGGGSAIEHVEDRYRLSPELDVDLWRLHHAVRRAATTVADRSQAWQAVIDQYGGILADGHTWPWLDPHRETVRRQVIDAHVALADAHTDPRQALTLLQDAIRVDPYNENLHQRAAHVLTVLGDHDTASALFDGYRDRLAAAGLAPAARTAHAGTRPS